ncbi:MULTISPECIES: SDR family oxidoreductase [unclassified Rathayibacter]|uniref:SDR family oxidoreductase n=1 Tax=unclassified Rathayibacter TaxID=2609250 RepID=UPI00104C1FAD|nr:MULTISPECIES: SDR family oxidoreductase [unclassified Rathayibacter]MCJ1704088.1 SDR family oxidoreductase [Rathayibacter sp. VKM Ac-2926]TCL83257.1 NAD(P)-dependent dehydrogenase (short-subunit alcohol dehydrogenase family) [Rathayibacter sp. PhB192]TCM28755.1 NAD(P)-dependent dehydrogenase (short-subunit alcohol dehydrogenase family) [Rathayibacter sp. PhB179]
MNEKKNRVLVVGGGSGIARALVRELLAKGDEVIVGGRHPEALGDDATEFGDRFRSLRIDLADEASIAAAAHLGPLDFVVSFAAAHANGPVRELERDAVLTAFDAKVIGPILLAKHLASSIRPGGGFLFFSGVAAWKPSAGLAVMATTNGAVSFLVEALAVELAPVRAVAISPGIIDSGAWDALGEQEKSAMFAETAAGNPARRIGSVGDIVSAVRFAMDNTFVTGTTLHVDGGGRLS